MTRLLALADSDSYLKWAAGAAERLAPDSAGLALIASPVAPSAAQRRAALAQTRWRDAPLAPLSLAALVARVREERPDSVLVGMRGPTAAVVLAELAALPGRPVLLSGLPGVGIPASRKALFYRAQADAMIVHSLREREAFAERAQQLGWPQRFAVATLPFLERHPSAGDDIVFAAQALVPESLADRRAIIALLVALARRNPDRRVVLKLRTLDGEAQTHDERYPLDALLQEVERPSNLLTRHDSMLAALDTAGALITVSSTALIEAVARGIPGLALTDFGVGDALINTVFEGSGLMGSMDDALEGRFRMPSAGWAARNYLHAPEQDDAPLVLAELVARREAGTLGAPRRAVRSTFGGPLRAAWNRRIALGAHEAGVLPALALVIGVPLRAALVAARRVRGRVAGVRPPTAPSPARRSPASQPRASEPPASRPRAPQPPASQPPAAMSPTPTSARTTPAS
ncbi:hypothetical protein OVN18_02420 [Microcella daejeonensis]|uniref:Uncharacterized protein n=1 Tax=Microcella daejeonensis TaxID=2994971 RepID=A0A9E8MLU0_9MICO|nr:DUF6716 putative glycosyltransferase [Microcella daejeonensis]WAB81897.1 hypothetical protein OVN18_02420 [Microcella daejeonensis]